MLDKLAGASYARDIAAELGVNEATVSRWLNFKTIPKGLYAEALKKRYPTLWSVINAKESRLNRDEVR